jgi:hypothetical protein
MEFFRVDCSAKCGVGRTEEEDCRQSLSEEQFKRRKLPVLPIPWKTADFTLACIEET